MVAVPAGGCMSIQETKDSIYGCGYGRRGPRRDRRRNGEGAGVREPRTGHDARGQIGKATWRLRWARLGSGSNWRVSRLPGSGHGEDVRRRVMTCRGQAVRNRRGSSGRPGPTCLRRSAPSRSCSRQPRSWRSHTGQVWHGQQWPHRRGRTSAVAMLESVAAELAGAVGSSGITSWRTWWGKVQPSRASGSPPSPRVRRRGRLPG